MVFFRVKKIKGKEYAYRVENKWSRNGSKQKVKEYIGRAYRFSLKNDIGFLEFLKAESIENYINGNGFIKIVDDLIEWEFFKFGISKEEFFVDLRNKKIQKNRKNSAILINDGFMCSLTLSSLLDFKPENDEENNGYRLARAFVEAGIKVPQDIFVGIYGKLNKTTQ